MSTSEYAFTDRAHEQRRLASQAELFDPLTERVFRTAGRGNGMRVLDLGSGAGDVAMLAGRLVGPEGEVVGVERDPEAVASATARVARHGLRLGCSDDAAVDADARVVPRDPRTGKGVSPDGTVVAPDLPCRWFSGSRTAYGECGRRWRLGLGVGKRDARRSAANGAVRYHDRRCTAGRYARAAPAR